MIAITVLQNLSLQNMIKVMEYHIRNNLEYHSKDRCMCVRERLTKPRGLKIKLEKDMVAYSRISNNL